MFSECTETGYHTNYEISTALEMKPRTTPQKTSELLMGPERFMRHKILPAVWWWWWSSSSSLSTNFMFCWPCISINLMFCWPCIIVYQYSETNVMHFLFSLLRINGLYMFRALLAHLQEALHKQHLVYCMHVFSVDCTRAKVEHYTKCCLCSNSWGWTSDARNM
jgi:hypothetical protein